VLVVGYRKRLDIRKDLGHGIEKNRNYAWREPSLLHQAKDVLSCYSKTKLVDCLRRSDGSNLADTLMEGVDRVIAEKLPIEVELESCDLSPLEEDSNLREYV